MSELQEIHTNRVVYTIPDMEAASVVSTHIYKSGDGFDLPLDVYRPALRQSDAPLPAVIFVHGDGPEEDLLHAKDWGQYVSYGQLIAASGLAAVTFNHRSTQQLTKMDAVAEDIDDLIAYVRSNADELGIDPERLCVWAISTGVPYGVCAALRDLPSFVRCVVAYYGYLSLHHVQADVAPEISSADLAKYSPLFFLSQYGDRIAPLLIARAGRDRPAINDSIDQFIAEAIANNVSFDLCNHAEGQHGFDIFDDTDRSRAIIRQTLGFVKTHLVE